MTKDQSAAHLLQMAVEALEASLKALDAIGDEMTVGERYTNAGQHLIDALPTARAAIAAIRAAQQPKPSIGDTTARSGDVGASDTELLDWLAAQGTAPYGWVARASAVGRGYRLHQSADANCPSPRAAIVAAMKGAKS